jgi:hypothetical protein
MIDFHQSTKRKDSAISNAKKGTGLSNNSPHYHVIDTDGTENNGGHKMTMKEEDLEI